MMPQLYLRYGFSILRLLWRKTGILKIAGGCGGGRMMSSSSKPSKISPWLLLPSTTEKRRGGLVYNFYSVADDEVVQLSKYGSGADPIVSPDDDAVVVGSSQGWLALMNRRNDDLYLSNPLSRRHIKLPPIDALPHPEVSGRGSVSRVVLSGGHAMMSFGNGDRLAFCRPGRSKEWTPIGELFLEREDYGTKYARVYDDFAYSSSTKLFNCLVLSDNNDVSFEDWDLRCPDSPRMDWSQKEAFPAVMNGRCEYMPEVEKFGYKWMDEKRAAEVHRSRWIMKHLVYVEHMDQLLVLFRYMKESGTTVAFTVARVEKEKGGKVRLVGCELEGLSVFVGTNHSFAVAAAERLKPNSIYFTDYKSYYYGWHHNPYPSDKLIGGDIGIFDCGDGNFSSCYYPLKNRGPGPGTTSSTVPASMWFAPALP